VWSLSQVVLTGYTRQRIMLLVGGRPGRRVRELPLNACRARRTAKEHQQLVVVHAPCAHSKLYDDAQVRISNSSIVGDVPFHCLCPSGLTAGQVVCMGLRKADGDM
jgi:hypothetical protein